MTQHEFDLGEISFYWRTHLPEASNHGIPQFIPFKFTFDPRTGLILQSRNSRTLDVLMKVYGLDSNVGYLQEGHDLASTYGGDYLRYIRSRISLEKPEFLELGCGGCYILKELKLSGHAVSGLDPSPIAHHAGERFGIKIFREFFPTHMDVGTYDCILHYDVLEHTEDPVAFLQAHHKLLRKNGSIIIAVPNCSDSIHAGDISMVLHEHLNYFDKSSLRKILELAGFDVEDISASSVGGVLYAHARTSVRLRANMPSRFDDKFDRFRSRLEKNTKKILQVLNEWKQIGIYVPLRATPYLCMAKRFEGLRFFDDDKGVWGRLLDGFSIPIENFDDFVRNPPPALIVASFSFGERIKQKVCEKFPDLSVYTYAELFGDNAK